MTPLQKEIMQAWEIADEDFPDKSTEFIIAIVCDRVGCDHGDVIDALAAENELECSAMTDYNDGEWLSCACSKTLPTKSG